MVSTTGVNCMEIQLSRVVISVTLPDAADELDNFSDFGASGGLISHVVSRNPTLLMRDDNVNIQTPAYACFMVTYSLMHVQQNLWSKRRPDGTASRFAVKPGSTDVRRSLTESHCQVA